MVRSPFFWLLSLVLGIVSYIVWQSFQSPPSPSYRTVSVDRGDLIKVVSANGTLNPVVLVNVGTQVSGTVQRLRADFNARVKAGEILAELDPALFRAALDLSHANLASAQASERLAIANEQRARELYSKDYIARSELDQSIQALDVAHAQVAAATAAVKRDETQLRYSVILSPVSGIVISRSVDVGQTVAASFQTPTLFTIAQDLKKMQIDTTVAEADVGSIQVGQKATFTVDAFPGREFSGTVRQIRLNSQVLQSVVTYNVVINVENHEEILMPGMTAFVNLVVSKQHGVLRIPTAALRFQPTEEHTVKNPHEKRVYRLHKGQVVAVPIQTGISDNQFVEVLGGDMQIGDALIVEETSSKKGKSESGNSPFRVKLF